jgi:hypothetical protein
LKNFLSLLRAKEGREKNKYGMLAQNFNRSTNVAMEHNVLQIGGRFNAANVLLGVWF